MADTDNLIEKPIPLTCPVCKDTYEYSLTGIMGYSFGGTSVAAVRLFPQHALDGYTLGAQVYSRLKISALLPGQQTVRNQRPTTREKGEPEVKSIEALLIEELKQPQTYLVNCPKDGKQFQVTLQLANGEVLPISASEAVTPGNTALYETGKQIQGTSLSVVSSFCTSMVTVSAGAVAIYTGLLALVLPKNASLGWPSDIIAIIPTLGFIIAAIFFALGAFPHIQAMRLSYPASIEAFRRTALTQRRIWAMTGFLFLCLAFIGAFVIIAWVAGGTVGVSPTVPPASTPTSIATPTP